MHINYVQVHPHRHVVKNEVAQWLTNVGTVEIKFMKLDKGLKTKEKTDQH